MMRRMVATARSRTFRVAPAVLFGGCRASSTTGRVGDRLGCCRTLAVGGEGRARSVDASPPRLGEQGWGCDVRFHTRGRGCDAATREDGGEGKGGGGEGGVARLRSRGVARLSGRDVLNFLQGVISNDVSGFTRGRVCASPSPSTGPIEANLNTIPTPIPTPNATSSTDPVIYAAALTPQGRFLYDLFLYGAPSSHLRLNRSGSGPGATSAEEPILFADVDRSTLDELLSHLKKYRLRAKVGLEDVSDDFEVWARFGGSVKSVGAEGVDDDKKVTGSIGWGAGTDSAGVASAKATTTGWSWTRDPRLPPLGFRAIFPANERPPLIEAGEEVGEDSYRLWRYANGVAEGPVEIEKGEAFPLEYNLDQLNAISYDKGCYVGQELTARTHHRGVIRKRLVPIRLQDPSASGHVKSLPGKLMEGVVGVIDTRSGKNVGRVVAVEGTSGIGVLRLQAAFGGQVELKLEPQELSELRVFPSRPSWWPEHWGNEEKGT